MQIGEFADGAIWQLSMSYFDGETLLKITEMFVYAVVREIKI